MNRTTADDTSTNVVVWAAAQRIGKTNSAQDINRICEYLVSKHWFQTAGDLRAAREDAQEWHALEVPGRLKIAIQEVLDASLDASCSLNATPTPPAQQAAIIPFLDQTTPQVSIVEALSAQAAVLELVEQPTIESDDVLTAAGEYESYDYNTTESGQFYAQGADQQPYAEAYQDEASIAAAWEAYYAANGYTTTGAAAGEWSSEALSVDSYDDSADVVEAEEVVVEEAIALDRELASFEPFTTSEVIADVKAASATWSCGQCTFLNSIESTFCDVCCGHVSLSPDAEQLTTAREKITQATQDDERLFHASGDAVAARDCSVHSATVEVASRHNEPNCLLTAAFTEPDLPPSPPPISPTGLHALEPPLYVSIPSPTKPLSSQFTPSAPDFENLVEESATTPVYETVTSFEPSASASTPSPPRIDYRALAFKRTASQARISPEFTV